jgi:hypothetical protein
MMGKELYENLVRDQRAWIEKCGSETNYNIYINEQLKWNTKTESS